MDFGCLILAAGKGSRFGMEKQYFSLRSKMLWQISYNLAKRVTEDVVVVGLDIDGGSTRQESVKSGLRLIDNSKVVILEIVRPLITEEDIHSLLEVDHPSVTYAISQEETLWNSATKKYINPKNLSLIKSLQVFDTKLLRDAHDKTKFTDASEDTCLMYEVHNIEPHIVKGTQSNLWKLTTKEDVGILEAMCDSRW